MHIYKLYTKGITNLFKSLIIGLSLFLLGNTTVLAKPVPQLIKYHITYNLCYDSPVLLLVTMYRNHYKGFVAGYLLYKNLLDLSSSTCIRGINLPIRLIELLDIKPGLAKDTVRCYTLSVWKAELLGNKEFDREVYVMLSEPCGKEV